MAVVMSDVILEVFSSAVEEDSNKVAEVISIENNAQDAQASRPDVLRAPRLDDDDDMPKIDIEELGYISALQHVALKSTGFAADRLDRRVRNAWEATTSAATGSIFFTSRPMEAAIFKPMFRLIFLCFALRNLVYLSIYLAAWAAHNGSLVKSRFLLSQLPLSSGELNLTSVGLLSGGFMLPIARRAWHSDALVLELVVDGEWSVEGWHAQLATDTDFNALRRVRMEGCDARGRCASAAVPWTAHVVRRDIFPSGEVDHTGRKLFSVSRGLSTGGFIRIVEEATSLLGFVGALCFSLRREGRRALLSTALALGLVGLSNLCGALAAGADAYLRQMHLLTMPTFFAHALGLVLLRRQYRHVLLVAGAYTLAWGLALLQRFGHHDWVDNAVVGLMQVGVWGAIAARRMWVLRQASRELRPDLEHYQQLWREAAADVEGVQAVAAQVAALGGEGARSVRQEAVPPEEEALGGRGGSLPLYVRPGSAGSLTGRRQGPVEGAAVEGDGEREGPRGRGGGEARAVRSLDQLYAQALVLNEVLKRKVAAWAVASGGLLAVRAGGVARAGEGREDGVAGPRRSGSVGSMYRAAREVEKARGGWEEVEWAGLKRPGRAVEKTIRGYDRDASLLLDICRQSIVFDSLADLAACLAAIHADPAASVLRVKNRYREGYDAAKVTAGYRDVAVNLRLRTARTKFLRVEQHVCELQLILRPFAEMKSEQGHKRYVLWRNLRAE